MTMKLLILAVLLGLSVARIARPGSEGLERYPYEGDPFNPYTEELEPVNPYTVNWAEIRRCYGVTKEQVFQMEQGIMRNEISDRDAEVYAAMLHNNLHCPLDGTVYDPPVNWDKLQGCYGLISREIRVIKQKLELGDDLTNRERSIFEELQQYHMRCPGDDGNDSAPKHVDWDIINECYDRTFRQLKEIMDALEIGAVVSDEDMAIIEELKKNNFQCPLKQDEYSKIYWENVDDNIFQQCTGISKLEFYRYYYARKGKSHFIRQVLAGECASGHGRLPLPRIPFLNMDLLHQIAVLPTVIQKMIYTR